MPRKHKKQIRKQISQQLLFDSDAPVSCGGKLRNTRSGRRKRTLDTTRPIHLVLKSSKARGSFSLRSNAMRMKQIRKLAEFHCQKNGISLYRYSNNFNHLHLLIRIHKRHLWERFIRRFCSEIAVLVTDATKGNSLRNKLGKKVGFWDYRPFTRIGSWGRDYRGLSRYAELNNLEAAGIPREAGGKILWPLQKSILLETG